MARHPYTPGAIRPQKALPSAKTTEELTKIAEQFGMSPMGAALDRLLAHPGEWLETPQPERIGRRASRPWTAYQALARRGLAEVDGEGRYRVRVARKSNE